jgi:hypothetical protein
MCICTINMLSRLIYRIHCPGCSIHISELLPVTTSLLLVSAFIQHEHDRYGSSCRWNRNQRECSLRARSAFRRASPLGIKSCQGKLGARSSQKQMTITCTEEDAVLHKLEWLRSRRSVVTYTSYLIVPDIHNHRAAVCNVRQSFATFLPQT